MKGFLFGIFRITSFGRTASNNRNLHQTSSWNSDAFKWDSQRTVWSDRRGKIITIIIIIIITRFQSTGSAHSFDQQTAKGVKKMFPNWGKRVLAMQFVDLERRSYAAHPMTSSRGIVVFRGSLQAIFLSLLCSWWTCADSLTRCFAVRLLPNFLWVRFPGANHRQTKMSRESKRERKRKKRKWSNKRGDVFIGQVGRGKTPTPGEKAILLYRIWT